MNDGLPLPREVKAQLERILNSDRFTGAPTVSKLLKHLVLTTLSDNEVSEVSIGTGVFNRPLDWAPIHDTNVRQNKRNLSARLKGYNDNEGQNDPVVIELTKGYVPRWRYNPRSKVRVNEPTAFGGFEFLSALEAYFTEEGDEALCCIVTEQSADWHHLDGRLFNNDFGNLVPLCPRLTSNLANVTEHGKTLAEDLEPQSLIQLAQQHSSQWKIGRAYGCAHLAFHTSKPPYGNETDERRLIFLCDALCYARCRHNGDIFSSLIHSLTVFLSDIDTLTPLAAHRISFEVIPILLDGGYMPLAQEWSRFTEDTILKPFESILAPKGRLSPFVRLHREAELRYNINPNDRTFDDLCLKAQEHIESDINWNLALEFLRASRWMSARPEASKNIYERLSLVIQQLQMAVPSVATNLRSDGVEVADLINNSLMCGLAACRLRPTNWQNEVEELFDLTRRLQALSGHKLGRNFWQPLIDETSKQNPRSGPIVKAHFKGLAGGVNRWRDRDFSGLLKSLTRIRFLPQS